MLARMGIARIYLLLALLAWPAAADAELPQLIALDDRANSELRLLLRSVDYPDESWTVIMAAIVGVLQQKEQPAQTASRFRERDWPFVNASSRQAGGCQSVEVTAWFPSGSRPEIRLTGRYCEHRIEFFSRVWTATTQRIRLLGEDEPRPTDRPVDGAIVEGP